MTITGLAPAVAQAHHNMDGRTPASFMDGLLSGLAHPVIGLDHLAMVLLIGAYCGTTRQGLRPLLAFVGAALVGCLVHVARLDLPQAEAGVAASLVLLGLAATALARRASAACTAPRATTHGSRVALPASRGSWLRSCVINVCSEESGASGCAATHACVVAGSAGSVSAAGAGACSRIG